MPVAPPHSHSHLLVGVTSLDELSSTRYCFILCR